MNAWRQLRGMATSPPWLSCLGARRPMLPEVRRQVFGLLGGACTAGTHEQTKGTRGELAELRERFGAMAEPSNARRIFRQMPRPQPFEELGFEMVHVISTVLVPTVLDGPAREVPLTVGAGWLT